MESSDGLQTGIIWIVLIYLLHTLGELCLSPVGLSSVTKLSPQRIVGFMMGMWFFASAAGNFVAGEIAKATASDVSGTSADVYDLVQKQSFIDVYTNVGLMAVGVAFVLLLLSPFLNSRSHGIK
jgi:POT family proton-dependent oligopeptide transporter